MKTGEEFNSVNAMYEKARDIGYEEGFDNCKNELMDVIEALANEVAKCKYPNQYAYSDEQIEDIMLCAGLDKKFFEY